MTSTRDPPTQLPPQGSIIDVEIDGLDDEGRGRATGDDDVQLAVRGAFPGDRARVKIERLFPARGLAIGRALEIFDTGPMHVERVCPHAAPCPGCPLEGLEPAVAHEVKRGRVVAALVENFLGHLAVDDLMASSEPYGSRQKAKLTAGGKRGEVRLGMYVPYSHVLVESDRCPYQDDDLTEAAGRVRSVLDARGVVPASVAPHGLKAVVLRAFEEGVGVVVVTGAPLDDLAWRALAQLAFDEAPIVSMGERVDTAKSNSIVGGALHRHVGPQRLTPLEGGPPVSVDAFCQADPELAAWMYEECADWLVASTADGDVLSGANGLFVDAYAGTGGFSRGLLDAGASRVVAIERAAQSSEILDELAVEPWKISVEEALPRLTQRLPIAGLVLDPPKRGLADLAPGLAALRARRVVIAACDPDAMGKDTRVFVEAGYDVVRIVPVDMFPGTPEVETVVFLELATTRS